MEKERGKFFKEWEGDAKLNFMDTLGWEKRGLEGGSMERKLYMARSSFHTPTTFPMDDAAAAGRRKNPVPDFLSKSKILSLFPVFVLEGRIERWGGRRRQTP